MEELEQENKYYTPELEEFYFGFQFEHRPTNYTVNWKPIQVWANNLDTVYNDHRCEFNYKFSELYRVKYLDKSDIESLGFEYTGGGEDKNILQNYISQCSNGQYIHICYSKFDEEVVITIQSSVKKDSTRAILVDAIEIKNISELKVLLKQLCIL